MWMIDNQSPFGAERNWFLDKNGEQHWVVAVRGAFDIKPDGSTKVAEKQEKPLFLPIYRGEMAISSLIYEFELSGPKTGTDVILNGHAYAPPGKTVTETKVRLKLHTIDKTLNVIGDRKWERGAIGPSLASPVPFAKMPIIYERAYGGWDNTNPDPRQQKIEPSNPVGTGVAVRGEHLIGKIAPNVELPGHGFSLSKSPPPAGFGAIPTHWSPRREFAGTFDAAWQKDRAPLWPADFDDRYYQFAPADQQIKGFLLGGERVELTNLTPGGLLAFALPKAYLTFTTSFGPKSEEHRANLHTVILEPDVPRVIMVWWTRLSCHHRADYLDKTTIEEKPYQ
jgi:hypothetical protein